MVNRRILFIGLVAAVCGASLVGAPGRADDLAAGGANADKKPADFAIDWRSVPKVNKSRFKPAGCKLINDEPPVLSDKRPVSIKVTTASRNTSATNTEVRKPVRWGDNHGWQFCGVPKRQASNKRMGISNGCNLGGGKPMPVDDSQSSGAVTVPPQTGADTVPNVTDVQVNPVK